MGRISGYQGDDDRSLSGTDFAMLVLHMPRDVRGANRARFDAIDRVPLPATIRGRRATPRVRRRLQH
ncbi:hypothetical protein K8353_01780 [Burkholderia contaminans]|nr:hypothetical protein [Burkholderia contaminans]